MALSLNTNLLLALALCACLAVVCSQNSDRDVDADEPYQKERRQAGEEEFDPRQDNAFDREVGNSVRRPRGEPSRNQVRSAYHEQKDEMIREANRVDARQMRRDMDSISFNPFVKYYSSDEWTSVEKVCCPREYDYGCQSQRVRLPCFYSGSGNNRHWCCPFWPTVFIKKCSCRRCAIFKPKCMKEGKCQKRYKQTNFYAVCYKNGGWNDIHYMARKNLPTSCYCLAD